jgi:hypothetical protein
MRFGDYTPITRRVESDVSNRYTDGDDDATRGTQGGRANRQVANAIVNNDPIPTGSSFIETDIGGDETEGSGSVTDFAENVDYSAGPVSSGSDGPPEVTTTGNEPTSDSGGTPWNGSLGIGAVLGAVGVAILYLIGGGD